MKFIHVWWLDTKFSDWLERPQEVRVSEASKQLNMRHHVGSCREFYVCRTCLATSTYHKYSELFALQQGNEELNG